MILFINSLTFFFEKKHYNFIDNKQNRLELQKKGVEEYPSFMLIIQISNSKDKNK